MGYLVTKNDETARGLLEKNNVGFKEYDTLLDAYVDDFTNKLLSSQYADEKSIEWCSEKKDYYSSTMTKLYRRNEECFRARLAVEATEGTDKEVIFDEYNYDNTNLDLQLQLMEHDPDDIVVLSRDEEGNGYETLHYIERRLYHEGDTYRRPEDIPENEKDQWSEAPSRAVKCITLYP